MKTKKFNRLLMLIVAFMTMCVTQVWGADPTITITSSSLNLGGSYTTSTKVVDGVTIGWSDLMLSSSTIQAKASSGVLYNSTATSGRIKSVVVTHSGTARSTTISFGTNTSCGSESTTWTGTKTITPTGNYTYFKITRGSNAAYWTSVVVTYEAGASNSPTITTSSSLSAFTATYGSASAEQTFQVGGSKLTANISVTAPANYEISKTSGSGFGSSVTLTKDGSGNVANTTLYIRLKNNIDAGSVAAASISCTSTGATEQTISIPASKVQSKVNWSVNGSAAAGSPTLAVDKAGKVTTLPTAPTSSDCDGSKVFVGWTDAAIASPTNTKPSTLFTAASGAPAVNVNEVTYYAVFANASGSASSLSYGWEGTMSSTDWEKNSLSDGNSYSTYKHLGSYAGSTGSVTTAYIKTKNKIASPTSATCYYTKASSNNNSSSKFIIQVSTNGTSWTDVSTGKTMDNVTQGTFEELTADLSSYSNVYVRFYYTGTSATRVLDDVSVSYGSYTYSNYVTTCGPATYTASVISPAPSNGSIDLSHGGDNNQSSISGLTGSGSETITINLTPAPGYEVGTVTVTKAGGGTVETSGTGNSRTFIMPKDNVTVSATFSQILVPTLTYNANGGTVTPPSTTTSSTTLPAPTKTGYNFAGWCENSDLSDASPKAAGTSYSFTESKTLYAKWTPKTYTITLAKGEGTTDGSATATYNSETLTGYTAATRDAGTYKWTLDGYYTAASGGTKVIDNEGHLVANVSTYTDAGGHWIKDDNATLTAHWTRIYTITWTTASGSTTSEVVDGNKLVLPAVDPESCNDIYTTFIGWYDRQHGTAETPSASLSGNKATADVVPTSNKTYYAVWADGALVGGEVKQFSFDFNDKDNWTPAFPLGSSNKVSSSDEASYTYNGKTLKVAGDGSNGYYIIGSSASEYKLLIGKTNSYIKLPAFDFKVSKIVCNCPASGGSGNTTFNIFDGATAVSTEVTGSNGTKEFVISSEHRTIGTRYTFKVTNAYNAQFFSLDIYSQSATATGFISTCCNSEAVATVTPTSDNLALNIDGTVSTTVSHSVTGTTSYRFYGPVITPAEGATATLSSSSYRTANNSYTFTATKAGVYTLKHQVYDAKEGVQCSKYVSTQITVAANPILTASVANLTVNGVCGQAGAANSFTINSRYLNSATVTVAATTTSGSGAYEVSKNGTDYSTSVTFDGGVAEKGTQIIYVRYEGVADESGAIAGNITISGGGASNQTVTLSGECSCGTYITLTPADGTATHVTAPNGQWTRTLGAIHIKGGYLQNGVGASGANIKLTSSNAKFKFTEGSTAGTATWESGKVTTATYDRDIYIVYTPTSDNANETTTITAKVVTYGGTTQQGDAQEITIYGRSLPQTFVLAVKDKNNNWVAVPADMIPPYGGSAGACSTGVGTHDPYPITVDNEAAPTAATSAPARAIYKGAARNTPTTWPWTVQFESNTQTGYMLWGSGTTKDPGESEGGDPTTIANQSYVNSARTKWNLISNDNAVYQLKLDGSLNTNKLGYNGTANTIGQYTSTATPYHYDFRILPVTTTPCAYYIDPVMTYAAYNATTSTLSIPYDGTTDYEYSIDGKSHWTAVTGAIDCKTLNLDFANATVKGRELWLRAAGVVCNGDATSAEAMHMLNPTITADASKEFNGVQNVAFNGEFAITTTDIWTGAGGGVQVVSSNAAINASYNSTSGKVELSMAAVSAGDYNTTLTLSSVGATDKTVNVTIHILSLATMNLTVTNANGNGLVCNAAATITTSKFYTSAGVTYSSSWGGTGSYTLYNLSDGTSITSGFTGAISDGVVTVTIPTAKMTVGNRYQLGWANTQNLTDATGLKYADAVSEEFVFSENCSAPTLLAPCILSPTSVNMQWVGSCGATNSTIEVYTKQTNSYIDQSIPSASLNQWKTYSGDYTGKWLYYLKGDLTYTNNATYGFQVSSTGSQWGYLYTPQIGKIVTGITASTEVAITVKAYNYTTANQLRIFVVDGEPTNTTGTTTGTSVKFDGETKTEWKSTTMEIPAYNTYTVKISGLTSTSRIAISAVNASKTTYITNVAIASVSKTAVTSAIATCADGAKTINSGLSANTTYYATITNNGNTSNEVSFKTYTTGSKSLTFKDGENAVTEVMVLGGAGQEKTINIVGAKLAGCDISTSISAGYSVDESALTFNPATGALSGSVVITLTDPGISEGTYTITDGAGQSYTLNLTSTNCPAGFNTMALAATDILANSATANWTSSVTSSAGHVVLYKNGIVNRELIENGGFESGDLTGWNEISVGAGYGCDAYAVASSNAHTGSKCLEVTDKGATGFEGLTDYSVIYSNSLTLEPGTYRFSAWVRVKNMTAADNNDNFVLAFTGGLGSTKVYAKSSVTNVIASQGYKELTADLTINTTMKVYPVVAVIGGTGRSNFRNFWLDDVSLKRISAPMGDEPDMNLEVADLSTGSLALSGLSGNTEYAYKITNEDGCESNVITFHTLAAGEPVITVTSPATISAPLASSNTGVSVVGAVDAFDVISITKTGDDGRFTLSRTTLPMEGGVLHYTFTPKNTDSPGDQGSITITFSTRGLSTPTELVVNWTITSGIDINTKMIEVTDVANNQITIEHNVEGDGNDVRVVFNRELEPGEITANVGDEVFFSKYYEAYMHKKLWAIYNPTDHDISLAGMQVWRSKGDYSNWNTEQGIDLSSMGNQRAGYICSNEEIIVYTADQVGSCEESQVDMSDWVGMTSKDQALSFSGDDALLLVRKEGSGDTPPATDQAGNPLSWRQYTDGESQNWYMLDIIGARKDDNTPDGSAIVAKWSWTNNNSVVEQGDDRGWVGCGYDMNNSKAYTKDANCEGYLLSTNRCLLVRRKDVKSGNNAVAVNEGDMVTLSSEWQGAHVPTTGEQAAVSCENFAFVGGYDYEGYYNHYTPLNPEDDYEYLGKNPDGSYSFGFEVPEYYCKYLRIEVVETQNLDGMEVDNIHAFTDYKVPIVIDEDKNTNNTIFTTLSTVCEECDVVVRDAAKLSHVNGGQGQFRDVYVYPGAKLDNSNKQAISLRTIYMQSRNDEVGYAIINDGLSSLSAQNIVHTKRVDDQFWYTFSLPYDCDIAAIRQVNGKTMGIYEDESNYNTGDWTIQYYDGAARQAAGTSAAAGENSEFWKSVPANGTLKAHQAYTIGLYTTEWAGQLKNVYFPPKETTEYTEEGDAAKTTTVTNWAVNLSCEARHHGWNFVGSPYISMFNETSDGQGLNNGSVVMKGMLNGDEYTDTEHVYVSIPDGGNSKTYTQALASATKLKPFSGYFVQVVDPTTGSSEEKTLTYAKGNRTLSAPARAAATRQKVMVELSIAASNGQVDNAGVLVDDCYTTAYEVGHDLTKLYVQGTKPQLYSIAANGEKMAYIALPDEAAYEVPIGIYAPKAGNYVLSMNEQVSRIAGAASVELLYQGQVVANLMIEDYTIAAQKGNVSGYSVRIQRIAQIATSTDQIDGESIKAIVNNGTITVENLPEDATVMLYDMVGKMLMSTGANGYNLVNLDVPAQGAYNITVRSAKGNATIKTIVR